MVRWKFLGSHHHDTVILALVYLENNVEYYHITSINNCLYIFNEKTLLKLVIFRLFKILYQLQDKKNKKHY